MGSTDLAAPIDPPRDATDTSEQPARARVDWAGEAVGLLWLVLAVLGFHSFIAKPFYIPSESMVPVLLKGDRLIVTKYPYGFSFVTPTFHLLPFLPGRLFGKLPERGDVVIVTPPNARTDYIKRVIGLPGDRLEVRHGAVILNGVPVERQVTAPRILPVDRDAQCDAAQYPDARFTGPDGRDYCRLPIVRETLPNGVSYDTVDIGLSMGDNFGPVTVPAGHVFLMGDNRDNSADSRFSIADRGLGGAVPWENIGGRAEIITFSLNGEMTLDPRSWPGAFRTDRAGQSLHPESGE